MGGFGSRFKNSSLEYAISIAEEGLGLAKLNLKETELLIHKHSSQGKINQSQLEYLANKLKFNIRNYGNNQKIESFFSRLSDKGEYELSALLVLFILLSYGEPKLKAKLLFEAFDPDMRRIITVGVLKNMFDTIFKVTIELGKLVCEDQSKYSNVAAISDYVNKLSRTCDYAFEDFKKEILGNTESISKKNFKRIILTARNGEFLDSVSLRLFLKNYVEKVVTKYANPFAKKLKK
jgi:hypothetical protein